MSLRNSSMRNTLEAVANRIAQSIGSSDTTERRSPIGIPMNGIVTEAPWTMNKRKAALMAKDIVIALLLNKPSWKMLRSTLRQLITLNSWNRMNTAKARVCACSNLFSASSRHASSLQLPSSSNQSDSMEPSYSVQGWPEMMPPPENQKIIAVPITMTMPRKRIIAISTGFGSDSSSRRGGSLITSECLFSMPRATAGGPSIRMLITSSWVAVSGRFQPKKKVETMIRRIAATLVEI